MDVTCDRCGRPKLTRADILRWRSDIKGRDVCWDGLVTEDCLHPGMESAAPEHRAWFLRLMRNTLAMDCRLRALGGHVPRASVPDPRPSQEDRPPSGGEREP